MYVVDEGFDCDRAIKEWLVCRETGEQTSTSSLSLSLSSRKVRRKKKGSASSYLARTRGGRPVGERREGGGCFGR